MKGFFSVEAFKKTNPFLSTIPKCGSCGLNKTCMSPNMLPTGEGRKKVLIVAEAPGEMEDRKGVQLIGDSGQVLRGVLRSLHIDLDKDCWKTNAVICRPPHNKMHPKYVEYCLPNLLKTIKTLQPNVIVLLGGTAVKSVLGYVYKKSPGAISEWAGWKIPCRNPNAWICPTYHPSYLLRTHSDVLKLLFKKHLKQALSLKNPPWKNTPPDYTKNVDVLLSAEKAGRAIHALSKGSKIAAFDFETTTLKPDGHKAVLYTCSICFDGRSTIAYPMYGPSIEATKSFLINPTIKKVASNLKFEERWARKKLVKSGVRGWYWDTMLAAHLLDNRAGITSIKFQSFVLLGQPCYNEHIEPYLHTTDGNTENRIRDLDLHDVLLYNGMDSLLEYKVAMKQIKQIGMNNV